MAKRSIYTRAGKSSGSYQGSNFIQSGIESQKARLAQQHERDLASFNETIGFISEGISLVGGVVDSMSSAKKAKEAMKGMNATEKKRSFGEWLVGSEKEYTTTSKDGKETLWSESQLKTKWQTLNQDDFKLEDTVKQLDNIPKDNKPLTLMDETNKKSTLPKLVLNKKQNTIVDNNNKTDAKEWFGNLFKGGADKQTTGDNVNSPIIDNDADDTINTSLWNQEQENGNFGTMFSTNSSFIYDPLRGKNQYE